MVPLQRQHPACLMRHVVDLKVYEGDQAAAEVLGVGRDCDVDQGKVRQDLKLNDRAEDLLQRLRQDQLEQELEYDDGFGDIFDRIRRKTERGLQRATLHLRRDASGDLRFRSKRLAVICLEVFVTMEVDEDVISL